jgi:hypothetical protein
MDNERLNELYGSNAEIDIFLSYSRVSAFSTTGPSALLQRKELSGEGINVGSITDDWLFNKKEFDNIYEIFDGEKPTATLGKLVDIILKNYPALPEKEEILNIIKLNEFWKRSKDETLIANFDTNEFWDYLKIQYNKSNKTIVTSSEVDLGKDLALTLKTHKYSSYIFSDIYEMKSQYKFKITYKNVSFRGIIDIIALDHKHKTIRLIDLKTGISKSSEFLKSFINYRYYFQEAVYMLALPSIMKELNIEDYAILPFQFLYIGRKENLPIVFDMTQKWHDAALNGFTTTSGYHYKGLDETLKEIIWHFDNKEFSIAKNIVEDNGNLNLNDDFFNVKTNNNE